MKVGNTYKRISDQKLFQITEIKEVFRGMYNWHDGPYYVSQYKLEEIVSKDTNKNLISNILQVDFPEHGACGILQKESIETILTENLSSFEIITT